MASLLRKLKGIVPSKRHPAPPPLHLYSHDAVALIESHIDWLNTPRIAWDSTRVASLSVLTDWANKHLRLVETGSNPSAESMESLLRVLDNLFFAGTLSANCTFAWVCSDAEDVPFKGRTNGFPRLGEKVLIELDRMRAGCFISTMLHEMCHAYIELYRCWGKDSGCRRWACQIGSRRHVKEVGIGGHGSAWAHLALTMEGCAKTMMPSIDLGIDFCIATDGFAPAAVD